MGKGEQVGKGLEPAAHEGQVKPDTRQPGGDVGEDSPAHPAHLLVVEQGAAQQAQGDEQQGGGDEGRHHRQQVPAQGQSQGHRGRHADGALPHRHGQHRQQIAQQEVRRRHGGGRQPGQKGGRAVFGQKQAGKQRQKGQPEQGYARRQGVQLKNVYRDIALNHIHQHQQDQREAQPEEQGQRVPE